jgi:hypothetical protein
MTPYCISEDYLLLTWKAVHTDISKNSHSNYCIDIWGFDDEIIGMERLEILQKPYGRTETCHNGLRYVFV